MSVSGGGILAEQAYAQGKMLDHSDWEGVLPRGITPSDVDTFFDNDGDILFCEFSRWKRHWNQIDTGQSLGYQAMIMNTRHLAVLCNHEVPSNEQINTFTDVSSYHIRAFDFSEKHIVETPIISGKSWQQFVNDWFVDPRGLYERVLRFTGKPNAR